MTKGKAPGMVKLQFILFGVLLLIFLIWGSRRCSSTQNEFEQERISDAAEARADSLAALLEAANDPTASTGANNPVNRDTLRGGSMQMIRERTTPLFVTIENLAMRQGPGLNYSIITRLKLYEEVGYMNEVTLTRDTIELGTVTAVEPWVKIRNEKGKDGWVYGAGVDYYKYKFEGID